MSEKVKLDPEKERERKERIRVAEKIATKREQINNDETHYLRRCGWTYTCDTPGSLWLWTRIYKGRVLLVSQSIAMHMQDSFNSGVYPQDE